MHKHLFTPRKRRKMLTEGRVRRHRFKAIPVSPRSLSIKHISLKFRASTAFFSFPVLSQDSLTLYTILCSRSFYVYAQSNLTANIYSHMGDGNSSSDQVIVKLTEMGFDHSVALEAIRAVGSSVDNAIEFILNGLSRNSSAASSCSSTYSISKANTLGKRALSSTRPLGQMRQSRITDLLQPTSRPKRSKTENPSDVLVVSRSVEIGSDWKERVNTLLRRHFGFSSLKRFQKEALEAWLAQKDCLVLAATGSGKSLCFQIPALLTGKVVVVISPLISLMHDQCLKLAKHGVSACFLGSGQPDNSVEQKAMNGMYEIIYVCPETLLRLITPLQKLAESRGIALFAIDEVHCVSKWGHDFRPDYRRLSVLRENFNSANLKFLKFDIPLMSLTATATTRVREDILKSLCMSKETRIVLTSFFRPNLRFSVKHSRTSSPSSYERDFHDLVDVYARNRKRTISEKRNNVMVPELEDAYDSSSSCASGDISATDVDGEVHLAKENGSVASKGKQMTVEYLEDDFDESTIVDDWDVACGEFCGEPPAKALDTWGLFGPFDKPIKPGETLLGPLDHGPTIIYVPTRKETLSIAKYLCKCGVRAAPYNAKLPKSHLRQVHKEFHENSLEVVVATIAFGMGIDKLNVRRIIHYGWPQSLEAYYQEAGRAGRDGKLADCILYANQARIPTLLPSQRNEDQTKQAYRILSDCFRYGMNTSTCRAKKLVEYFGEDFSYEKCLLCDVCVDTPPELQNFKEEADAFMQVLASHYAQNTYADCSDDNLPSNNAKQDTAIEKPNLRMVVSRIREQFQDFTASDLLWWRGFARILEDKGYIREGCRMIHVQIKIPEPTELGLEFLQSKEEQSFSVFPEADMLLSMRNRKPYSSFSEWGKGWANPEIRRQRLERIRSTRKLRKRKLRKRQTDLGTVRGRLAAKFSKKK